jgi:hypothetical protein
MAAIQQRIDALTPTQVARLTEWRDKWLATGLSTAPADRPAAEAAVREAYGAAGLAPPKIVIWLRSPMEGAIGAAMLAGIKIGGDQVGDQVGDQDRAKDRGKVSGKVWDEDR